MTYEIDYNQMDKDDKKIIALKDIDNYLNGQKIFIEAIQREIKIQDILFDAVVYGCTYRQYSFTMKMNVGVSGYPIVAFWNDVKDSLHTMTQ